MKKDKQLHLNAKIICIHLFIFIIGWSADLKEIRSRVIPKLKIELNKKDLSIESQVFVRIFKQDKKLELWIKKDKTFEIFKMYPICEYSGELGPKIKNGDRQAPEGIYKIKKNLLNPNSKLHLGINIGYPNEYDRYYKRNGSAIMIHGGCVSVGCYAMTDSLIEEIYVIFEESLKHNKYVSVHIYPFELTSKNIDNHNNYIDTSFIGSLLAFIQNSPKYKYNEFIPFWKELKAAYDFFEENKILPSIQIINGHYVISSK